MAEAPVTPCKCTDACCRDLSAHIHRADVVELVDAVELQFPPGCNCERIDVGTSQDEPGTKFIRGRSDPPCRVHLPSERALYDAGYAAGQREGHDAGYRAGYHVGARRG